MWARTTSSSAAGNRNHAPALVSEEGGHEADKEGGEEMAGDAGSM